MVRDSMSVSIINMKVAYPVQSFDWYRRWWLSMTLNGVIALILRFWVISQNSIALQADYVTVVEDRPIMSAECRLPLLANTNAVARSVCDSWATCFYFDVVRCTVSGFGTFLEGTFNSSKSYLISVLGLISMFTATSKITLKMNFLKTSVTVTVVVKWASYIVAMWRYAICRKVSWLSCTRWGKNTLFLTVCDFTAGTVQQCVV